MSDVLPSDDPAMRVAGAAIAVAEALLADMTERGDCTLCGWGPGPDGDGPPHAPGCPLATYERRGPAWSGRRMHATMSFTTERQPRSRRPNLTYERAEALRAAWAVIAAEAARRSGYTPAELAAMTPATRATVFRDEGLPSQRDFARAHAVSEPLLSSVLRGKAYAHPPAVVYARRGAALRRLHAYRHAAIVSGSDTRI